MSGRKFVVGGNWKMNGTTKTVDALVSGLNAGAGEIPASVDVFVAPPFVYLHAVKATLNGRIAVAAQNCHAAASGAFTGEIAVPMLQDLGVATVVLGHSERRAYGKEEVALVGQKALAALAAGLRVIFCCGETLAERQAGRTDAVVLEQLAPLAGLNAEQWAHLVIAYEPVWAIGTGVVATPEQAQEAHASIRRWLHSLAAGEAAAKTTIQYGGSVNAKNCEALASLQDVDGFLVGGASLQVADFLTICKSGRLKK